MLDAINAPVQSLTGRPLIGDGANGIDGTGQAGGNGGWLWGNGGNGGSGAPGQAGGQALDRWISWAQRCRIPVFVELAARIKRHRVAIDAALDHGLSQGLIESTNTKIRLLTRIAFGFRSPQALIALAMLALAGHRPTLPGRHNHPQISQ